MNDPRFADMLRTARMQARIAVALYKSRWHVVEVAADAGAWMKWFDVGYARAALVIFQDHAHLVVCGTNDAHDWVQNLSARLVDDSGWRCHQGFSVTAHWLKAEFRKHRIGELIGDRPLVIGGHSAGGAIAQLLSQSPDMQPREMVTFGAPRVFHPRSAASYSAYAWEVRRFVMVGDPVPGLPLRKFLCLFGGASYAHTSTALWLSDDGEVLLEQEAGTIRKIASLAASAWLYGITSAANWFGKLPTILGKHSMERYAAGIDQAIARVEG